MCHQSECGCEQHPGHRVGPVLHHRGGCCCGSAQGPRRFISRDEMVKQLDEYLGQIRAETRGVEERIAELRKEG